MKNILQSNKTRKKVLHFTLHIILICLGFLMLLPFFWMLSASFKPEVDIFKFPIKWIPETVTFLNYDSVFNNEFHRFDIFYRNSLIIAISVTFFQLLTCSLAGYAFSKIEFPGREKIFMCYLGTLMVPFQVIMVPLFIMMSSFGLLDTLASLILIGSFSAYGVFLLRQFYISIPQELSGAAAIDGCGHFGCYWRIMVPNLKPAFAALGLFTFLGQWNNFLGPLVFLNSPENYTIAVGLKVFVSEYNIEFGKMMAATTLSLIPIIIVFFIAQKYFVEGIVMTGVKG